MVRDDFSKDVKMILCQQVGGKCAKPDCRVTTIGPHENDKKRTTIGVAAHITAAAKGGPRYDESMSKKERKSASNGIWLCQNHAWEIDTNFEKYSVCLLKGWKKQATLQAEQELGKKQFSQTEADAKAVETLMTHVQPDFQKNKMASLIQTVHQGVTTKYESLDPRFSVLTQFDGEKLNYRIDAREDTRLTLNVFNDSAKDFSLQFQQLLAHGTEIAISTDNMEIKGSPLFEQMIQKGGTLKVIPIATTGVLKLITTPQNSKEHNIFDDIVGKITYGTESTTFNGMACDGLLSASVHISHKQHNFHISFKLDWQKWLGCPLTQLPFFNKTAKFFRGFKRNASLEIGIELQGEEVFQTTNPLNDILADSSGAITMVLNYLDAARTICRHTQSTILFDIEKVEYQADDYDFVLQQAALLQSSKTYYAKDLTAPITVTFNVEDSRENLDRVTNSKPSSIRVEQSDIKVKLLDQWIQLPTKRTTCKWVVPKVTPENTTELKVGDEFEVTWEPTKDFECFVEYIEE